MGMMTWPKLRRRCYFLGGLLVVLLLAWIFRAPILTGYAKWFINDNATKGTDGRLQRLRRGFASGFLADFLRASLKTS